MCCRVGGVALVVGYVRISPDSLGISRLRTTPHCYMYTCAGCVCYGNLQHLMCGVGLD